jgi:hypothetical protein
MTAPVQKPEVEQTGAPAQVVEPNLSRPIINRNCAASSPNPRPKPSAARRRTCYMEQRNPDDGEPLNRVAGTHDVSLREWHASGASDVSSGRPLGKPEATPLPMPRVRVKQAGNGQVIEPVLDEAADPRDFKAAFLAAFGTSDDVVAEALCGELLNCLHTEPGKPVDSATANLALALMHGIGPKDTVEGMLACQMVVAHVAAMDASRRALHVEQTPDGRQAYLSFARKLMTLYATQVDTLNRHRGKTTTQKVIVEKMLVVPSAQSVVGSVVGRGEGGGR